MNANPTITSSNPFKTHWKGDLAKSVAQSQSHLPLNLMLACLVPLKKISSNPDWTTAWKELHALSWTQQWLTTWVLTCGQLPTSTPSARSLRLTAMRV